MIRLIVNADDFGLTSGVNRAVLELHKAGVLTSATLMARAAATDEAIEIARATPTLGVGCHVVLVDGEPMQAAAQLLTLADSRSGRFHPKLGAFLRRLLSGKIVDAEIEAEARAQIQSLQKSGLELTHVDTHKHTHMFPRVLRPVLRAAKSCGIRAVRNPFERAWSVAATPGAPVARRLQVRLLRTLESRFCRIVAEEGFTTTDGAVGVVATGTLDQRAVASLLSALPPDGIYELVTHPGYNDAELAAAHTRLLTSRETEREALLGVRMAPNMKLISFASLVASANL
ncbi:MAG TPA: ChbG/HpnK family deacetylase [Terracidiphilus sp.]